MLHTDVVEGKTLSLLKQLEKEDLLSDFNLAGGTALALYLGHRKSVDLDLFTPNKFDTQELRLFLEEKYNFRHVFSVGHTLKGSIDGIKVDLITHAYNYIQQPFTYDGIRLYGMADIIAMKLSAITDNGTRLKDFLDISFLSTKYSFLEMLSFYRQKFPDSHLIGVIKALTYYEDIDFNESVILMNGQFEWEPVAERLRQMVVNQQERFDTFPIKIE